MGFELFQTPVLSWPRALIAMTQHTTSPRGEKLHTNTHMWEGEELRGLDLINVQISHPRAQPDT